MIKWSCGQWWTVVTMRMGRFIHLQSFYMVSLEISEKLDPWRHMGSNNVNRCAKHTKQTTPMSQFSCVSIYIVGSNLIDWIYPPDLDYRFHITRELQPMLHLQPEKHSSGVILALYLQHSEWSQRDRLSKLSSFSLILINHREGFGVWPEKPTKVLIYRVDIALNVEFECGKKTWKNVLNTQCWIWEFLFAQVIWK